MKTMQLFTALLAGFIFGFGLLLSGMTNPENIQNFLDISGNWDPALMFVMVGAIMVSAVAFFWIKTRPQSLLGEAVTLPTSTAIDRQLLSGAALFGIGWGLVGLCPGPALASITSQPQEAGLFVFSMVTGMLLSKCF